MTNNCVFIATKLQLLQKCKFVFYGNKYSNTDFMFMSIDCGKTACTGPLLFWPPDHIGSTSACSCIITARGQTATSLHDFKCLLKMMHLFPKHFNIQIIMKTETQFYVLCIVKKRQCVNHILFSSNIMILCNLIILLLCLLVQHAMY